MGEECADVFAHHTPEDTGRDIISLLEAEEITDAILIGCSYAGASVVYAASKAPTRVRGIVLINPFAWVSCHNLVELVVTSIYFAGYCTL